MKEKLRQHIENLMPLSDDEFALVSSFFKIKRLKKHQYIVQEETLVDKDFWVVKGLLRSYFTDGNGKEHILQFAMEDWWITDYQAYFNKTSSTVNIDCLEDTELLYISLEDRKKLCNQSHKMANFFRLINLAGK